jgi:hypothetical protein
VFGRLCVWPATRGSIEFGNLTIPLTIGNIRGASLRVLDFSPGEIGQEKFGSDAILKITPKALANFSPGFELARTLGGWDKKNS